MTLRTRLLIALAAIAVTVLGVGLIVLTTERHYLVGQVDRQLRASAAPAARLGAPPTDATTPPPEDVPRDLVGLYVAVIDTDAKIVSVILPGRATDGTPDLTGIDPSTQAASGELTRAANGGPDAFRVRIQPVSDSRFIVVALPLSDVNAAISRLRLVLIVSGGVVLVILALAGWWVARLGLRPIHEVTNVADAIAAGDLARRVDHWPAATEAGRLSHAFNLMLDQRQAAEERLRQFVADASHELRSPLTSIGGYVSLYRRGGLSEPERLDDAMRRIGQESARMHELVEDLLLLAQLDQGRPLVHDDVDVAVILDDVIADAAAREPDRPVHLELSPPLHVVGDEARLRQVFGAIVTNAYTHTGQHDAVTVRGHYRDGSCVIEISDDGPGMTEEFAAQAFERFTRGDPGRARAKGGTGLGLAIVNSIVAAHGGYVMLDTAQGHGCTVRVFLPTNGCSSPATVTERTSPRGQ